MSGLIKALGACCTWQLQLLQRHGVCCLFDNMVSFCFGLCVIAYEPLTVLGIKSGTVRCSAGSAQ
jgi:hypothetical protein